ncbi:transglutaminase domain-containing protein [Agromyces larvae]|uniref:Transglutaminase-like domain-containing protein n=1 Tax=Agromyces larvae TaxID=2929802 RepID=A0ABY4C1V4_9MICO|nr:transglutaminase domain-containing protein [Agromyces larvae]UOE43961.1 hypothetical protein MTO99_17650 [Agromyces larvae]
MTRGEAVRSRARRSAPAEGAAVRWLGFGYLLVGAALAGWAAWPIHEVGRVWLVAATGLGLGIGAALLGRRLGGGRVLGALVTTALAALGYVLVVVPVAVPHAMGSLETWARGIRDGATGIVLGWKQVLTLEPPLGDYQAVLVPFLVVTVVATTIAAFLIDRGGRAAPFAVLPVLAMSVYGIAFGTSAVSEPLRLAGVELAAAREIAIGVAGLAAAGAWLVARSRMLRRRSLARARATTVRQGAASAGPAVRRNLLAASLVVVALVGGVAAAPAVASLGPRTALRDEVEPAVVMQQQASPLAAYRSWFTADLLDETVLTVSGDLDAFDRLPFAALEEFDGEVFHVDPEARYTRLPRSADSGAGLAELEVVVGGAYSGVWVPAPPTLAAAPVFEGDRAEVLADGFHVTADGGAVEVADADGVTGLRAGDRYRLVAEPTADAGEARSAFASSAGGESALDAEAYPSLTEWVDLQEVPRTGAGYLELVEQLRARGYLSHSVLADDEAEPWISRLAAETGYSFLPSYAGHSRARIEELFAELVDQQRRAGAEPADELLVAGVGDDEQFAAAAALLARQFGFESRVVLGVRLPGSGESTTAAPVCDGTCTGASLTAWAEVRAGSGAWVSVDASPQFAVHPNRLAEGEQLPKHPTVPDDARSEPLDPPPAENDAADTVPPPADDPAEAGAVWVRTAGYVGAGVLAALLIVLPFAAVVIAKTARARARRSLGDPELSAVSAWEELRDRYADEGIVLDDRGGRARGAAAIGRPRAAALAEVVDRAVFAADAADPALADEAWRLVDAERRELAAERRRLAGLRAALTLRSLLQRVRPTAAPRTSANRLTHPKEITS